MAVTRRDFLKSGTAVAAASGLPLWSRGEGPLVARPTVRWEVEYAAPMPAPSAAELLVSRATWGAGRGEVRRAEAMGLDAWLEEQLDPPGIDDSAVETALATLPSLAWDAPTIFRNYRTPFVRELQRAMLFRAVHSRRQLYERVVEFWSDHFSINQLQRNEVTPPLKTVDDRDVTRAYALGGFRAILNASMHSPCMLAYLDNLNNKKGAPNENYGRELLELHTLGVAVNGVPYTEGDVKAAARILTGWSFDGGRDAGGQGQYGFLFKPTWHEPGDKTILGTRIPEGGEDEGLKLRDLLVDHPATRRYLAGKLVARFVSDEPPPALVDTVAAAWGADGDTPDMLRALFRSPEFLRSGWTRSNGRPAKVRRPIDAWVGAIRAVGGDATGLLSLSIDASHPFAPAGYDGEPEAELQEVARMSSAPDAIEPGRFPAERFLELMGQVPYAWPFPNGYPDRAEPWMNAIGLLVRWNMGLALAENRVDGVKVDLATQMEAATRPPETVGQIVDFWIDRTIARPVTSGDRAMLVDFLSHGGTEDDRLSARVREVRLPGLVALLLDSPYFLWR